MLKLCSLLPYSAALLLVGSRSSPQPHDSPRELEGAEVHELNSRALACYRKGEFRAAANTYRSAYRSASRDGARRSALVALNNAAGSSLAAYDYNAALNSFLIARELAEGQGDRSMQAVIWLNLSSLYLTLDNVVASEQAALHAAEIASGVPKFRYRAEILAQLASFQTRKGDPLPGLRLFREAIDYAEDAGNFSLSATLSERAGWILLDRGDYQQAEPFLLRAFRRRLLFRDRDLRASYLSVSRLLLAQGEIGLAAVMIDRAAALPPRDAGHALWLEHYQRGLVRMSQNRIPEARIAFGKGLEAAASWHEGAASSDQSRIASGMGTHQLAQAFVDASVASGAVYYAQAFLAAEQDRAAGLRLTVQNTRRPAGNTEEFSRILGHLRAAQTALLAQPLEELQRAENKRKIQQLRSELSELETRRFLNLGVPAANITERTSPLNTLRKFQDRIRPGEVLLSLYPGVKDTYLWAVTTNRFEFHRLESGRVLAALADRFAASVEMNAADRDRLGQELYDALFGQLSPPASLQQRWIITADDALSRIPFPALMVARVRQHPVYLVELHSVERIPSAWMLSRAGARLPQGAFVGIGDGIYNPADPRWLGTRNQPVPLQLARLVASGQEVQSCVRQWAFRSPAVVLTGARASREEVQVAVKRGAAVIHFAAHFLYPGDRREEAVIDLGLNGRGQAELLTQEDVANWNTPDSVVVMSGCSSAAAGAAAGAGILGLSRAWLMAGASTVVGSLWPTPDDSGQLFQRFYSHLGSEAGGRQITRVAADALRSAQIEMVRSVSWRSEPRYWGAFYVIGKD
jgi:CHAT domain-containing protein